MAPQAKRRRSNTDASESIKNGPEDFPPIESLKQHEEFRLDDASIVLATNVHLYRVHKSILAKNSTVFKDMLEIPTGDAGNEGGAAGVDQWDGLPLVRMVGDDDEGIYHLLMTLYDREYFRANKPIKFQAIISLLQLSSKYDIPGIRHEVIHRIQQYYPTEYHKWDRDVINSFCRDAGSVPDDMDFQLLAAASRSNATTLLPTLFYECASHNLDAIFKYSDTVTKEDFQKIIMGREKLTKLAYEFASSMLYPHDKCDFVDCHEARMKLFKDWLDFDTYNAPLFPLDACEKGIDAIGDKVDRRSICGTCREVSSRSLREFQDMFWEDSITNIFNLGIWDTLKRTQT